MPSPGRSPSGRAESACRTGDLARPAANVCPVAWQHGTIPPDAAVTTEYPSSTENPQPLPENSLVNRHDLPRRLPAARIAALFAVLAVAAAMVAGTGSHRVAASTTPPPGKAKMFAFYYLWWSKSHWLSTLGSSYPAGSTPLPLPARLAS